MGPHREQEVTRFAGSLPAVIINPSDHSHNSKNHNCISFEIIAIITKMPGIKAIEKLHFFAAQEPLDGGNLAPLRTPSILVHCSSHGLTQM